MNTPEGSKCGLVKTFTILPTFKPIENDICGEIRSFLSKYVTQDYLRKDRYPNLLFINGVWVGYCDQYEIEHAFKKYYTDQIIKLVIGKDNWVFIEIKTNH